MLYAPAVAPQQPQPAAAEPAGGDEAPAARLRRLALSAFLRLYPWVYAGHEGARFAYQLAYLLGRTPYYSPGLHLLRLAVVRVTGQDLVRRGRGRRPRAGARGCCADNLR